MMDVCESAGHLAANQVGYHLFDRRVERAMLPYTKSHGIGFMAYGTLGFGLLTGAFNESTNFVDWDWRSKGYAFGLPLFQREQFLKQLRVVDRLRPIAARHGKSVAQLAISWVLGDPAVTVALVGIRRSEELKENVAAVEWRLSPTNARKSTPSSPKRASPPTPKPPKSPNPSSPPADPSGVLKRGRSAGLLTGCCRTGSAAEFPLPARPSPASVLTAVCARSPAGGAGNLSGLRRNQRHQPGNENREVIAHRTPDERQVDVEVGMHKAIRIPTISGHGMAGCARWCLR